MVSKTKKARPGLPGRKPPKLEVADSLRAQMDSGELKTGDLLPSLSTLCTLYSIAQNTAKAAIDVLREQGLQTESWPGYGVVIKRLPAKRRAA